jgi:hypothetical protein
MSNPIKYSTGTETLALKKGNFYIGTGDVGKGPTSSTGYYNGITPPTGGYTIYLNKETGGPSIYTVANDNGLIGLTNSIAGQSYTTVNECLVYFAGQTDKVVLNRDYEGIVTNGLIFNLDAGFTPSYPRSGTTWYDLGGTNNGTLINGPTFSGGSIVFDGTDDYINLDDYASNLIFNAPVTFNIWLKPYFNINIGGFIFSISNGIYDLSTDNVDWFSLSYGAATITLSNETFLISKSINSQEPEVSNTINMQGISNGVTYQNTWVNLCVILNTDTWNLYLDSNLKTLTQSNYWRGNIFGYGDNFDNKINVTIGALRRGELTSTYFNGEIPVFQIYNRALSADEVLQNFNAQKGRFGL